MYEGPRFYVSSDKDENSVCLKELKYNEKYKTFYTYCRLCSARDVKNSRGIWFVNASTSPSASSTSSFSFFSLAINHYLPYFSVGLGIEPLGSYCHLNAIKPSLLGRTNASLTVPRSQACICQLLPSHMYYSAGWYCLSPGPRLKVTRKEEREE